MIKIPPYTPVIFIVAFIVLWFSNTDVIKYISGYDFKNPSTHHLYKWVVVMKDVFYETMFVLALLLGVFKRTRLSKALSVSAIVIVVCSIIDKWIHKVYDWTLNDTIVILFAIFLGSVIYYYTKDGRD